jgi:hypothetical protein
MWHSRSNLFGTFVVRVVRSRQTTTLVRRTIEAFDDLGAKYLDLIFRVLGFSILQKNSLFLQLCSARY